MSAPSASSLSVEVLSPVVDTKYGLTNPAWLILLGAGVLAITALMSWRHSSLATISCSRRSDSVLFLLIFLRCPRYLKGTQSALDNTNLDTSFATLKSVYLNPKSNVRVGYIQKSALIFPNDSFDIVLSTCPVYSFTHPIILFHHIWLKTVWIAYLAICKSAKKLYPMRMYIS